MATENGSNSRIDLVEFLSARLVEDERIAQTATDGPWSVDDKFYTEAIRNADGTSVIAGGRWGDEASVFETTEDARHIARHDPDRVLREVEAKRDLILLYREATAAIGKGTVAVMVAAVTRRDALHRAVATFAAVYADHPDYREEWRDHREGWRP